jgi:hypothetical protein
MSKSIVLGGGIFFALCVALMPAVAAGEPVIGGEYIEARTCDVWTGPCFANGEINFRGDHAILGWVVSRGSWNGVQLDGLSIVAVIDSQGTLTTPAEGKVRTVLYVDQKASREQEAALIALAAELAPRYTKEVVKIHRAKIAYERSGGRAKLEVGHASLANGIEVKVATAPLNSHCDSICGNEESAYPALSSHAHVDAAKALENFYRGSDLDVRWNDPNHRSAMIGTFAL